MANVEIHPGPALTSERKPELVGAALALVTLVIWAVWIVGTRQAVTVDLPLAWIGILRFGIPTIVLLPFWWRVGLFPAGVDKRLIALMVGGAGAPFLLVTATGMRHATAAEIGVLLGGTMPLFVAILSAVIYRETFTRSRIAGLALIVAAMVAIGGRGLFDGAGIGVLLLPFGAFLWALYTVAFKRTGIGPIAAAGLIAAWSTMILVPFAIADGIGPLLVADPMILAGQVLSQGILSGVVALVCYGGAVARLGASRAAVLTAFAPALAALIAIPVLGEIPTSLTIAGMVLAVLGIALGSGVLKFAR